MLARIAERAEVSWSFRISRGMVAATLREAVPEVDAIALCKGRDSMTRRLLVLEADESILEPMAGPCPLRTARLLGV
jgi:hypothetical protein